MAFSTSAAYRHLEFGDGCPPPILVLPHRVSNLGRWYLLPNTHMYSNDNNFQKQNSVAMERESCFLWGLFITVLGASQALRSTLLFPSHTEVQRKGLFLPIIRWALVYKLWVMALKYNFFPVGQTAVLGTVACLTPPLFKDSWVGLPCSGISLRVGWQEGGSPSTISFCCVSLS